MIAPGITTIILVRYGPNEKNAGSPAR